MSKPADAQVTINGLYYKVGLRSMVFVWACGEWMRSNAVIAEEITRPFESLKLGDSYDFSSENRHRIRIMASQHEKQTGKKFRIKKISNSFCRITRVLPDASHDSK